MIAEKLLFFYMNKEYPIKHITELTGLLTHIPDPPEELYMQGNTDLFARTDTIYVCIVGPRKPSPYGEDVARHILETLKPFNVVTVSGIAYGIDGIVHNESIRLGIPTIAVPGSGIDDECFYPRAHLDLKYEILEHGGLVLSEFDPDARADIWTFPIRNRLMAGMSHITIVIEAEKKSGTLITGHLATDYGREVIAVPGSVFSHTSTGTHTLISKGAQIYIEPQTLFDVLKQISTAYSIDILHVRGTNPSSSQDTKDTETTLSKNRKVLETITPEERKVFNCISSHSEGVTKEYIVGALDLSLSEVSILTSLLELHDLIRWNNGRLHARF